MSCGHLQLVHKQTPDVNFIWQKPKRGRIHYNDPAWYEPQNVGHDPLERFMKHMSQDINLCDQTYTNHCIRSTVLNTLGASYKACHIMGLSDHKNESSIKQYAVKVPKRRRKKCSTPFLISWN